MVLLDTSAVVDFLRGRSPLIRVRLNDARHAGRRIAVSSVTVFELWYGAFKGAYVEENTLRLRRLFAGDVEVIAFDERDAEGAGALRTQLERAGTPIGPYDLLIAAHARRLGATLVTANVREFARVPGLTVEDWSRPG